MREIYDDSLEKVEVLGGNHTYKFHSWNYPIVQNEFFIFVEAGKIIICNKQFLEIESFYEFGIYSLGYISESSFVVGVCDPSCAIIFRGRTKRNIFLKIYFSI